jgi:tRNA (guanine-N7-)-methyltransferase
MNEQPLRTYGRVKGRALKPRQARLMETLLPALSIPEGPVNLDSLAPGAHAVWLEAGFGGGEHLTGQAMRRPDALFLGAEPFVNGLAACLGHIEDHGLANVRLYAGDVRTLMARLPDASLERIIVLFPDPWPKARHKKRRLIEPRFIAEAARLLRAGGRLRIATDWADYAHWILQRAASSSGLRWTAERACDWREPPADHIPTRYEAKRLGDCAPVWLEYERV